MGSVQCTVDRIARLL